MHMLIDFKLNVEMDDNCVSSIKNACVNGTIVEKTDDIIFMLGQIAGEMRRYPTDTGKFKIPDVVTIDDGNNSMRLLF